MAIVANLVTEVMFDEENVGMYNPGRDGARGLLCLEISPTDRHPDQPVEIKKSKPRFFPINSGLEGPNR